MEATIIDYYNNKYSKNDELELIINNKNINKNTYSRILEYLKSISNNYERIKNINLYISNNARIETKDITKLFYLHKIYKENYKLILNNIDYKSIEKKNRFMQVYPDLNIKIKLSSEEPRKINNINKIELYRYRDRVRFYIDLTKFDINDINTSIIVDLTTTKSSNNIFNINNAIEKYELEIEIIKNTNKNISNKIFDVLYTIITNIVYDSILFINEIEINTVIENIYQLFGCNINLKMPVTLNASNVIELQSNMNNYIVLDKADGIRYLLYISNKTAYAFNVSNKNVKKLLINEHLVEYENTVFDGELLKYNNKHYYLIFDCLFYKNNDIRNHLLLNRLEYAKEFVKNIFGQDTRTLHEYIEYLSSTDNIIYLKYYTNENAIEHAKDIWNTYMDNYPYVLDGIIFQSNYKSLKDYKWKPADKNTIDFLVVFRKRNNRRLIYYDNTITNEIYYMCDLYVNNRGQLELFDTTYIFCRLADELNIQDNNIVEFRYDINYVSEFKWIPMRVRFDKDKPNALLTANHILSNINNPVDIFNISVYYNIPNNRNIVKEMRIFHNAVKTYIIKKYAYGDVLDYAVGRGGDLKKYVAIKDKINLYVGIDKDAYGLFYSPDSALNRYKKIIKNTDVPFNIIFINADGAIKFNVEDQKRILNIMGKNAHKNYRLIEYYLDSDIRYDTISIQFAIHYFNINNNAWNNFMYNINKLGKKYILITTFDSDEIHKLDNSYTVYDDNNEKIFEIIKLDNNMLKIFMKWISSTYNVESLIDKNFLIFEFNKYNYKLVETKNFMELKSILYECFNNEIYKYSNISKLYRYYIFERNK